MQAVKFKKQFAKAQKQAKAKAAEAPSAGPQQHPSGVLPAEHDHATHMTSAIRQMASGTMPTQLKQVKPAGVASAMRKLDAMMDQMNGQE